MFNRKTFVKFMVAAAAVLAVSGFGALTASALEDFTRGYGYGGVVRAPNVGNGPGGIGGAGGAAGSSGAEQRPILEVNAGFDAGGVLGCSGLDLGGMLQNTFNVGNLGNEFKNYLQNTIATEALSLLYAQPGVSQVLDGMKAIGHARVSIQQEQCNANEILANVTNKRLRDEGHEVCIKENSSDPGSCAGDKLAGYVEEIAKSRRWSGTLHDHVCPEGSDSGACRFLPNFAYDIGSGEGRATQAPVPASVVGGQAEYVAEKCFEARAVQACGAVTANGYSEAMRRVASGEQKITCNDAAIQQQAQQAQAPAPATPPAPTDPAAPAAPAAPAGAQAGIDTDDCTIKVGDKEFSADNVYAALTQGNVNPSQLIEAHTQCLIAKEIHGHVDIKMCMLPEAERVGMRKALSQSLGAKSAVNVYNALIQALSEAIIKSGGGESADAENSMNPQMLEFIAAQLEAFKSARDSIITDQRMTEDVAERVSAMNERIDTIQEGNNRAISGSLTRGVGASGGGGNQAYRDLFR